jgi:uncharacterized cupin superfamily protein
MPVPEAHLERTAHGLVPRGDGWFVLNARESAWHTSPGGIPRAPKCDFEGAASFPQIGINISVLAPDQPLTMYHWESNQEDFLVLAGEALLIVEGVERPLRQWDFVHCPAGARHSIVGAGSGPSVVLAVGAREEREGVEWGGYSVDQAALAHGAGIAEETSDPSVAYAAFSTRTPAAYEEGWLPGA